MTKTSNDVLADVAIPRTTEPLGPSPSVAAEIMARRLQARSIHIAGECDARLVQALRQLGVEVHGGAADDRGPGDQSRATISGRVDLVLCTVALDRLDPDEASHVVADLAAAASRVLLAPWWTDRVDMTADAIRGLFTLFARHGFTPVPDGDSVALIAVRLEQGATAGGDGLGDLVARLLAREQAVRHLAADRRARLARIAADDQDISTMSARLREAHASLRSMEEARRLAWTESLPFGAQLLWLRLTDRLSSSRRRRQRLAEDIRATGLFDENFYRSRNPYVTQIGMDPAVHFALVGWKMDRRPNPVFAPLYYASQLAAGIRSRENPLLHFARTGWKQGLRPSPEFDAAGYLASRPDLNGVDVNPLRQYVEDGYPRDPSTSVVERASATEEATASICRRMDERRAAWAPLPVYLDAKGEPTVTILLDDVERGVAFDRPGTALIVGCLIARRLAARLRIVTRGLFLDPSVFGQVLGAHGIVHRGSVEFAPIAAVGGPSLAITRSDKVLATSWTSARAALSALPAEQVLYLVQDDECASCVCGDERVLCQETLSNPKLAVLVATRARLDALAAGDRSGSLAGRARSFEPPASQIPAPRNLEERTPRNVIFYADRRDRHNLYRRGLEVLHASIDDGTLSPQQWTFHFVGRDLDEVALAGGVRPLLHDGLGWGHYSTLIASADLGLYLAEGAALSQFVLDLASTGAVVVTNAPEEASRVSGNILPTRAGVAEVCSTLRRGAALAADLSARATNRETDEIPRTWDVELTAALDGLQIGSR